MMISVRWLSPERIDALIRMLDEGDLMEFGYCPSEGKFTPAVFGFSGTSKEYMKCGFCELSSYVHPAQHYPGYLVRTEMDAECIEELVDCGLDTIDGQKKWLRERIEGQYDEVEQEIRQLMGRVQEFADEKRYLIDAIRLLREV